MSDIAKTLGLEHPIAEAAVLSVMRSDLALATDLVGKLNQDCFVIPENKLIFRSLENLLHGIEPIDTTAIVNMANGLAKQDKIKCSVSYEYVSSLSGDYMQAIDYVATLTRYNQLRGMAEFAFWFVSELEQKPSPESLYALAQEKFSLLRPRKSGANFVYGWDTSGIQSEALRNRRAMLANGENKIFDFPWHSWNEVVAPLTRGMLGAIYGPTKAGKSVFLEMIAEYWASLGNNVVLVHLEDDLQYKLNRRTARHSKLNYNRIITGNLTDNELKVSDECEARLADLFSTRLHYYHAPGVSMHEACAEIDRRCQEGVCDAVVIDYLDKFQPSRAQMRMFGDKIWEMQAHDSEQLKTCMERNGIAGFTAGQGTKEMQDSTDLNMRSVAGSGQKLHKMQLVMMFGRQRVGEAPLLDADGEVIAPPGSLSPIIDIGVVAQNQGDTRRWKQAIGKNFVIKDIPVERVSLEY